MKNISIFLLVLILGSCKKDPSASFFYQAKDSQVIFVNNSANSYSYYWDFGDGAFSRETNPTHYYRQSGRYDVSLSAKADEKMSTCNKTVEVLFNNSDPSKPFADFTYIDNGLSVMFFNTSKNANRYAWNFGDNITSSNTAPTHVYKKAGTYNVSLTAESSSASDVYTNRITVSSSSTSSELLISSITVNAMPFNALDGRQWDVASGPDVCFKISNVNSTIYQHPTYKEDVSAADLPIVFTLTENLKLSFFNEYTITVYDYDNLSGNDEIKSFKFLLKDYTNQPSNIKLTNGNCTITVGVIWI
ncbi:MAG: PKD domain-containing protein [Bacteroidales bacterium]